MFLGKYMLKRRSSNVVIRHKVSEILLTPSITSNNNIDYQLEKLRILQWENPDNSFKHMAKELSRPQMLIFKYILQL